MRILLTGGTGYIGSHVALLLLEQGHDVIIVDNLYNSKAIVLNRIETICGKRPTFYKADVCNSDALTHIFAQEFAIAPIDIVVHFAGYKAVGESIVKPIAYYQNNILSTFTLIDVMQKYNCKHIVFSSSSTVYGIPESVPIIESMQTGDVTNPYGRTKHITEEFLKDIYQVDNSWNITLLRYFNPIGAHPSGLIGEDPLGIPNNLIPYMTQVAVGTLQQLTIFGNDYDTPDGTCIRDYIHVMDVATGHISAIDKLHSTSGLHIYNLGTGKGYSVLEVHAAFEKSCGRPIPYTIAPRRTGDVAICYGSPLKALHELGWRAKFDLETMMRDAWNWQQMNPKGYC